MASICAPPSWQINRKSLLCLQNLYSSKRCQTTQSWFSKVVRPLASFEVSEDSSPKADEADEEVAANVNPGARLLLLDPTAKA